MLNNVETKVAVKEIKRDKDKNFQYLYSEISI